MDRKRILVVDDEIYIVHILEFSLSMEGYEVVTASDGEQALAKIEQETPDLVVLDIMMPGMDGYEVCRAIRAEEETRELPVILLSAKGRSIDQEAGMAVGADDYMVKPFSPRKLLGRIRDLLEKQELGKASNF